MCFFLLYLGIGHGGGGSPKGLVPGLVHNLLMMQFFGLYSSKIEDLETYFFCTVCVIT